MPKGKPIDPALKSEIVSKICNAGMTVSAASAHNGVNSKTNYAWLRAGVVDGNRNLILENNKLKKSSKSPTASLAGSRPSLSAQKVSCPGRSRARMARQVRTGTRRLPDKLLPDCK